MRTTIPPRRRTASGRGEKSARSQARQQGRCPSRSGLRSPCSLVCLVRFSTIVIRQSVEEDPREGATPRRRRHQLPLASNDRDSAEWQTALSALIGQGDKRPSSLDAHGLCLHDDLFDILTGTDAAIMEITPNRRAIPAHEVVVTDVSPGPDIEPPGANEGADRQQQHSRCGPAPEGKVEAIHWRLRPSGGSRVLCTRRRFCRLAVQRTQRNFLGHWI